jgi:hypothetical protein
MKAGRSLTQLAAELQRQLKTKKDYVVDSKAIGMTIEQRSWPVIVGANHKLGLTNLAHGQLANRLGIPKVYYDKMREEEPGLLRDNVNAWLHKSDQRRMLRTLDGNVRAFLSDRYRPLDNFDLAEVVLPELQKTDCRVVSCEVTESHMYLKAVTDKIKTEVAKGDVVQAGMVISNSEVGCGSLRVEPLVFRLVCLNGMIAADHAMKKYHVGRRAEQEQLGERFFSDETRRMTDKAFWRQVRDVVRGSLSESGFAEIIGNVKGLQEFQIAKKTDPRQVIEDVTGKLRMTEDEQSGVLKHLIEGGDLSAYGVMNAVTRTSQEVEGYDRATDLERFGGILTNWNVADWRRVGMERR